MNVLNKLYAVYKGKEYEASVVIGEGLYIYVYDEGEGSEGFQYDGYFKRYKLFVKLEEIDRYFSRSITCDYHGCLCNILYETETTYRIWTFGEIPQEERETFERVDKADYEKTIDKSEVTNIRHKVWEYDLETLKSETQ